MFEKKVCNNCGRKVKADWKYCPYCGANLIEEPSTLTHSKGFFDDIDKEFEKIDKFGFPSFKMSKMRGGGISITIQSGNKMKPKVKVETSGKYKNLEPKIKRRLGVKPAIKEIKTTVKPRKLPKTTEEPETKIENLGNKQVISIKLPGVKSEDDVEIKKLEQSIEVKAFGKDKAYFKLIPIQRNALVSKKFNNKILRLEIIR